MKLKIGLLALFFCAAWGTNAFAVEEATVKVASPSLLKGEFGGTGTDMCLVSSGGFDSSFQPVVGSTTVYSEHFASEEILTFDGKGHGTLTGTSMVIIPPPVTGFSPSASSDTFGFSFTYTVYTDSSFTYTMVPGSFSGTALNGTLAGLTFTIDVEPTISGLIASNGATLTQATLTPTVETLTFPAISLVEPRICWRSHASTLLKAGTEIAP